MVVVGASRLVVCWFVRLRGVFRSSVRSIALLLVSSFVCFDYGFFGHVYGSLLLHRVRFVERLRLKQLLGRTTVVEINRGKRELLPNVFPQRHLVQGPSLAISTQESSFRFWPILAVNPAYTDQEPVPNGQGLQVQAS